MTNETRDTIKEVISEIRFLNTDYEDIGYLLELARKLETLTIKEEKRYDT